ncbi:MAG: hypothetical protein QOG56_1041, partial [Solirubrobacteraceae bacterium]|nr:hypothetical protein [Solirubrobacteraceae bacterium]
GEIRQAIAIVVTTIRTRSTTTLPATIALRTIARRRTTWIVTSEVRQAIAIVVTPIRTRSTTRLASAVLLAAIARRRATPIVTGEVRATVPIVVALIRARRARHDRRVIAPAAGKRHRRRREQHARRGRPANGAGCRRPAPRDPFHRQHIPSTATRTNDLSLRLPSPIFASVRSVTRGGTAQPLVSPIVV